MKIIYALMLVCQPAFAVDQVTTSYICTGSDHFEHSVEVTQYARIMKPLAIQFQQARGPSLILQPEEYKTDIGLDRRGQKVEKGTLEINTLGIDLKLDCRGVRESSG
jgi:hypothetical protein